MKKTFLATIFTFSTLGMSLASAQDLTPKEETTITLLKSVFSCQQRELDNFTEEQFLAHKINVQGAVADEYKKTVPGATDEDAAAYVADNEGQITYLAEEGFFMHAAEICLQEVGISGTQLQSDVDAIFAKYGEEFFLQQIGEQPKLNF